MTSSVLIQGREEDNVLKLLEDLLNAETSKDCANIGEKIGEIFKKDEPLVALKTTGFLDGLEKAGRNKKSGFHRESAMIGFASVIRKIGRPCEVDFLPYLPVMLDLFSDRGEVVRAAAKMATDALLNVLPPVAVETRLIPSLIDYLDSSAVKWPSKVAALELLGSLAKSFRDAVATAMGSLIPCIRERMHDTKGEVSRAAIKCMLDLCTVVENNDIIPHIPKLVDCMARPETLEDCIKELSATTFVATVESVALAVLVPILKRALAERSQIMLRMTVIITDNLCKLVPDPAEASDFLPELIPEVERIAQGAAMPEVRALASHALTTLNKAAAAQAAKAANDAERQALSGVRNRLQQFVTEHATCPQNFNMEEILSYVCDAYVAFYNHKNFNKETWVNEMGVPYLTPFVGETAASDCVSKAYDDLHSFYKFINGPDISNLHIEDEELVNTDFSLAYGGRLLLNHTNLRLYRGHRYGVVGHNGCGKSTLLKAIADYKVENFPPPEQVKTCFVAHSLQGEDTSIAILDFVANDPSLAAMKVTREEAAAALKSVGFTEEMQKDPVASLSGGWKMKLELARAMLQKADILLLDEPTNHLDAANIAWVEAYLNAQTQITCLMVSHDSSFLDHVCTDIIHYEGVKNNAKKLGYYPGNLSAFVEKKPEAKSYYTLSATNEKFVFPPPGILAGVRSNTRVILKMTNASYTYPGSSKKSLDDVTVGLSLSSRVAILGPNGAGKSTLIKVLIGEVIPQEGRVFKHPNLRVGYVAQHAFHHLDQHLEKTPSQYIQWRYAGGQDREVLEKETRKLTDEDRAQLQREITVDGERRRVEALIGRQKFKKSFQYEIKWLGKPHKYNNWIPRELLLENGFQKFVQAFDDMESSREGLGFRDLIPEEIRKHFEDVGLPGDIADYSPLSSLSGGQKVKVVIAACLWNNPQLLVLDEPTNFLDRDALGGLATAIRDWGGGVVMISHNAEFVSALCPEQWHVVAGKVTNKDKAAVDNEKFEDLSEKDLKKIESKTTKKKKLTRNEMKAKERRARDRELAWLSSPKGTPKPKTFFSDDEE
ncbi:AAA family ATPase ELf1 [Schizosaccharomyces cryophilus OY26]|uniref:AAA family ATPase ELf1 n=1 Tax=Schizosaccharomyces cryophilus (strain OY26 / ATCC MYA-4695 / CBS 11777 / NBRC 106824 / NRRL Y48691) TaxID=653667 RepID=S9W0Y7_SCHCR|nr:AAA family ATPase ELf1 [Schizosaccharomyces cryophilus OY26]EPY51715.1 AAA family ATPase ELf1 [Schizosaccharomyces cryophilus OY26]